MSTNPILNILFLLKMINSIFQSQYSPEGNIKRQIIEGMNFNINLLFTSLTDNRRFSIS